MIMWQQWPPVSLISGDQLELITSLLYFDFAYSFASIVHVTIKYRKESRLDEHGDIHMAAELHVSSQAIYMYDLKRAAAGFHLALHHLEKWEQTIIFIIDPFKHQL